MDVSSSAVSVDAVPPRWNDPSGMLGVDEARARILAAFAPLDAVAVPIAEALGLVLAETIAAGEDIPPFTNAAMDGFAVRATDTAGASSATPCGLRVVDEVAAGQLPRATVTAGTAVRIMTGAPMPAGADAVVRFEETDEATHGRGRVGAPGGTIAILRAARRDENVRPAGEDVRVGETVLERGTRLRPAEIGLLAALGRTEVAVHRRPKVAVLATGDEVVAPGEPLQPGQIHDSNSAMVAALVRRCGGEPVSFGIAKDATEALRDKLRAASGADLLLTSGGVSMGDYDVVKDVLRLEGRIELWQVRIKPGKPLAFGRIGGKPLIGLPGNPVAAAVVFEQFVRPAILTLLGRTPVAMPTVRARLLDRVENQGGRRHFVRVRVEQTEGGYVARLAGGQGAGVLSGLSRANGLLVVPEELTVAEPGVVLAVQMFDWDLDSFEALG